MKSDPTGCPLGDEEIGGYLEFAWRLAQVAGDAILPHFRADLEVENKACGIEEDPVTMADRAAKDAILSDVRRSYGAGQYDPVTIADRAAEDAIRGEIRRVYPDHGIHGEERGRDPGTSGLTWVIDPIDGTRAFVLGQLHWGTLIALNDGQRPVLGVMHQPFVGETFFGSGRGAFRRDRNGQVQSLRTRSCANLASAALCASNPDQFATRQERTTFDLVASRARLTRYGGDCYNYCLLAAGLIDLVIESALHAYDVQALIPIVEAAGGVMTDWTGQPCYDGGAVIAAGDSQLHRRVLVVLAWTKG
jgi:histidinol phosphatase-like enzyme (inositol monophosphatase family)